MITVLRVNEISVIPNEEPFDSVAALEEYQKLPKPKPEYSAWLIRMGYVRLAPVPKESGRKPRASLKE
jgi:hypothetical protein